MRQEGLEVERPKIPTSLEISTDEAVLSDPHAYAVKVLSLPSFKCMHLN